MAWSFSIGRYFGSDLRVHATFFLLLAWIGGAAYLQGGPMAALVNVAFVVAIFACVVAHEYGHALMARRFGIKTPDITLLPIGGLARLERMPEKPSEEIQVAVAGPLVNVAIGLVLTVVLGAEARLDDMTTLEDIDQSFLGRLAAVNLFLVLFNMIPAFPMDGGRVLRATLAMRMDRVRATQVAARGGQAIAFLLGLLGLLSGSPILLLIAVFVFLAAGAESSGVALQDKSRDVPVRDAMITAFESLVPSDTLDTAAQALLRTTQHEFPVLSPGGSLMGILTREALIAGLQREARTMPVSDAMSVSVPTMPLNAPLNGALEALSDPGVPAVAITDRTGVFLGYITRENVGEWMLVGRS